MRKTIIKINMFLIIIILGFLGCEKECLCGKNSLLDFIVEPIGENCSSGGIKIVSGIDLNSNNILDENEIQNIEYVCNGENGDLDKQIIIRLRCCIGVNDTVPWIAPVELPFFDITTYSNIVSAVFVVSDIRTCDYHGNDTIGEGTFELYDITNNQVIENSIIVSDDIPKNTFKSSTNLIDFIPKDKIKLGIRLRSGGAFLSDLSNTYLILSR